MSDEPKENVSITIPISMVEILDHYCRRNDLTRSQATTRALRQYLAASLAKDNAFWEREYTRLQAEGKI